MAKENMNFSESKLIECGQRLSVALNLATPKIITLKQKINEILIERGNYLAAKKGIITEEEMATLLLQHFQTLICKEAGVYESKLIIGYNELIPEMIDALFLT